MGCGANYHLRRAAHHLEKAKAIDSTVILYDTVVREVSTIVPEAHLDTTVASKLGDTVVLTKDRLVIKYVKLPGDSVWVEGKCETDTIYQTIEIPVPVAVVKESYKGFIKRIFKINDLIFYIIHISLILLVIGLVLRKIMG